MTKPTNTLVGQQARINVDAETLSGEPHADAGKACTVVAKNKGGNYQLQVDGEDRLIVLHMSYFSVGSAVAEDPPAAPAQAPAPASEPITDEIEKTNGGRIVSMEIVPLASIHIGKTNPRKFFDDEELEDLAENIKLQGILQPLLVRPRWTQGWLQGDLDGYELVAGERRYRASKIAGLKNVPVLVRSLDDLQTLEVQIVENVKRVDLSAIEEAESYQLLMKDHGYTVDMIAEKIGGASKKAAIYARLKLCALVPEARELMRKGILTASTALLVARIPVPSMQVEAAKKIANGFNGDPMSARFAAEYVQREYMLELSRAKFKITDATLVPAAGNCKECPKRTGANPVLYPDVKNADVCTDPVCFNSKVDAHLVRLKEKRADEGRQVIDGISAAKLFPHRWSDLPTEKFFNSASSPVMAGVFSQDAPSIEKLLGKDAPAPIYIENPHSKELIKAYAADAVKAALKAKGIAVSKSSRGRELEDEKRAKAETAWRQELALRTCEALEEHDRTEPGFQEWISKRAASTLWRHLGQDLQRRVCKLMKWESLSDIEWDQRHGHEKARIEGLTPIRLARFFLACDIAQNVHCSTWSKRDDKDELHAAAKRFNVDVKAAKAATAKPVKAPKGKKPAVAAAADDQLPIAETA